MRQALHVAILLPVILAFCITPTCAATFQVLIPEGIDCLPELSLYPDTRNTPLLRINSHQPEDIPAGQYQVGIRDFPGRIATVDVPDRGTTSLQLAVLILQAPPGAEAHFGVFNTVDGRLISPLTLQTPLLIPAGRYHLRRDLSTGLDLVTIRPGEVKMMEFGSVRFENVVAHDVIIHLQSMSDNRQLSRSGSLLNHDIPLLPGRWRIRTDEQLRPSDFEIQAGQKTTLGMRQFKLLGSSSELLEIRDSQNQPLMIWPAGKEGLFLLSNHEPDLFLQRNGQTIGQIPQTGSDVVLWQESSGRCPQLEGITITIPDNAEAVAIPGQSLKIGFTLFEAATVECQLRQHGQPDRPLHTGHLAGGWQKLDLLLPVDLKAEGSFSIQLHVHLSGNRHLRGQSGELTPHFDLISPVRRLQQTDGAATWITLEWLSPESEDGVKGYNVYRGSASRPLNGQHPLTECRWQDIALSAGREYQYRVCPVDGLSREGPSSRISIKTPAQ